MTSQWLTIKARMVELRITNLCARGSHWMCRGRRGPGRVGKYKQPCECFCHLETD
jgi:hypothetical protein